MYTIPKRMGYPRLGKVLSVFFVFCLVALPVLIVFEDNLFTRAEAGELLAKQGITLFDDFEIDDNQSEWWIGDGYSQTFTLCISENDKQRAIAEIRQSPDFKEPGTQVVDLQHGGRKRTPGPDLVQNYETDEAFVREYLKPAGNGYSPMFIRISIVKKGNTLKVEYIGR